MNRVIGRLKAIVGDIGSQLNSAISYSCSLGFDISVLTMDVKDWMKRKISEETGVPIDSISEDEDFSNFSLDSLSLVDISFQLENELGLEIDPTAFSEYPTIAKLTEWLGQLQ